VRGTFLWLLFGWVLSAGAAPEFRSPAAPRAIGIPDAAHMSYLDNGVIRVGVDLAMGGVITYLSKSGDTRNVINSHDLGREVQQSYYSGPRPFGLSHPAFPDWSWNPIGAGDIYGNRSQVVASSNDGTTVYIRAIPMQWALDGVPGECYFETWIALDGSAANVRYRLTNHRPDLTTYSFFYQELPAVYTTGKLYRLFTYDGPAPFTDAPIREIPFFAFPPWHAFSPTENWMALVDESGWGLGVHNRDVYTFVGGFSGTPNVGGPADDPTGYVAPAAEEILDHNITYDYEVSLVLGTLPEIRAFAVAHRRLDTRPDIHFALDRFQEDRQHVGYVNASDTGLPFRGGLHVRLDRRDPQIWLPLSRWDAASMPVLYVRAAFRMHDSEANVFWAIPGEGFSEDRRLGFPVVPDGQFRDYAFDLATSPAYAGTVTRLRLDPGNGGVPGDFVEIAAISYRPPSGAARVPRVVARH